MALVRIDWIDSGAFHQDGWQSKDAIIGSAGLSTVVTVGEMFHEDEDKYYVALTVDEKNGQYFGTQVIWKNAVKWFSYVETEWTGTVTVQDTTPVAQIANTFPSWMKDINEYD